MSASSSYPGYASGAGLTDIRPPHLKTYETALRGHTPGSRYTMPLSPVVPPNHIKYHTVAITKKPCCGGGEKCKCVEKEAKSRLKHYESVLGPMKLKTASADWQDSLFKVNIPIGNSSFPTYLKGSQIEHVMGNSSIDSIFPMPDPFY